MTKPFSTHDDNAGRCEACNTHDGGTQQPVPVFLAGGLGMGTMWMCRQCVADRGGYEALKSRAKQNQEHANGDCCKGDYSDGMVRHSVDCAAENARVGAS